MTVGDQSELAINEAIAAVAAAVPGEGSATEALRRYIEACVVVSERYAFLLLETPPAERRRDPVLVGTFKALLKRGRDAGEFTTGGTPDWWMAILGGVLVAAVDAIEAGERRDEVVELAAASFLGGIGRA